MSQKGKVAFITGGLGGIGLAFGENLLQQGAQVALVDLRDGKETEELKKKYGDERVISLKCDVTDNVQLRAAYQKAMDTFGGLDIVVNAAGLIDEVNFERTIAVNVTSLIASSYMAVERMRKDRGGRGGIIINMASIGGVKSFPYLNTYCATKAAVISFSQTLVANLEAEAGVQVGTMCPTGVETALLTKHNPNPKWRENDITEPYAEENLKKFLNLVETIPLMQPQRLADTLMKYLEEPGMHGSAILVTHDNVEYLLPEQIKGKKIEV